MNLIRRTLSLVLLLALAVALPTAMHAQAYYPGSVAVSHPNFYAPTQTFTATSQTGATITLPGVAFGTINVVGTALTTATWAVQGSADSGTCTNFTPLPAAAIGAPGTTALTETTTANGIYIVNLAGIKCIRFVTSGTFTGTNIKINVVSTVSRGAL